MSKEFPEDEITEDEDARILAKIRAEHRKNKAIERRWQRALNAHPAALANILARQEGTLLLTPGQEANGEPESHASS